MLLISINVEFQHFQNTALKSKRQNRGHACEAVALFQSKPTLDEDCIHCSMDVSGIFTDCNLLAQAF